MLAVAFLVIAAALTVAGFAVAFGLAGGLISAGLCVGLAGWELLPSDAPGDQQ